VSFSAQLTLMFMLGAPDAQDARLAAASARCAQLAELVSCDAALNMRPNDPALLVAEADVLVRLKRPGEAIGVYRNSLRLGARQEAIKPKIALAESQRRGFVDACMIQTDDAGVRACESAWLPGAPDEVSLFKRRGLLLAGQSRTGALEAYMSAARLAPQDRNVAREIVNLSASLDAKDASILMACGAALVTLGRPQEAIASFKEALRLAPDLAEAKARLRMVERSIPRTAQTAEGFAPESESGRPVNVGGGAAAISTQPYTNEAPVTRSN
jgi:tetratricopeptide (TPR) repeat protein